jgi:hypothetical protein
MPCSLGNGSGIYDTNQLLSGKSSGNATRNSLGNDWESKIKQRGTGIHMGIRLDRGFPQTSNQTYQPATRTFYHVLEYEFRDPLVGGLLSPKFESPGNKETDDI